MTRKRKHTHFLTHTLHERNYDAFARAMRIAHDALTNALCAIDDACDDDIDDDAIAQFRVIQQSFTNARDNVLRAINVVE